MLIYYNNTLRILSHSVLLAFLKISSELEKKEIECLTYTTDIWNVDSGDVEFRTTEDIIHSNIENTDWNCSKVGKVEEIVGRAEAIRLFEGSSTIDWFKDYVRSRIIGF